MTSNYHYKLVATGGTFDRFHKGHEALLTKAFLISDTVIIGITSDDMVKKEKKLLKENVLLYEERVKDVMQYLKKKKWLGREIIVQLDNVYGPTVIEKPVEAIVCTKETRYGAIAINKARERNRFQKADIVECQFIVSDDNRHISSTRIRLGEIDREGNIYSAFFQSRRLPKNLRIILQRPIGKMYRTLDAAVSHDIKPVLIASVGDYSYQGFKKSKRLPDIAVVDNKIKRKSVVYSPKLEFDYRVRNPAGTVTKALFKATQKSVKEFLKSKRKTIIKVIGEEDLAVIPLIIVCPLNSLVIYGQPSYKNIHGGVVSVVTTEEKKKWAISLLDTFLDNDRKT